MAKRRRIRWWMFWLWFRPRRPPAPKRVELPPLDVVMSIRFRDDVMLPYAGGDDLEAALGALLGARFDEFMQEFPEATFSPRISSVKPERLQELIAIAKERTPGYEDPGWLRTYKVVTPPRTDAGDLASHLESWKDVVDRVLRVNTRTALATFLHAATADEVEKLHYQKRSDYFYEDHAAGISTTFAWGVDAEYAWSVPGGTGDGGTGVGPGGDTGLVDLEQGWTEAHEDLPTPFDTCLDATLFVNGNPTGEEKSIKHGTNVLGILFAEPNTGGQTNTIGMAHACQQVALSGEYRRTSAGGSIVGPDVVEAIAAALDQLDIYCPSGGGVLLLETSDLWGNYDKDYEYDEQSGAPIEFVKDVWEKIEEVTASWHTVVEAAGNAGLDLDDEKIYSLDGIVPPSGGQSPAPVEIHKAANDSLAIIVGAADPPIRSSEDAWLLETAVEDKHWKKKNSCFGSRVDCWGWGGYVPTTEAYDPTDTFDPRYTTFGDTSAAAAIVAGVVLLLQGIYRKATGGDFLKPDEMRELLRDSTLGTPVHDPNGEDNPATPEDERELGPMPDLFKILTKSTTFAPFNLVPDVYLRDNIADSGDPHTAGSSKSPDIIVKTVSEADPAGTWDGTTLLADDVNLSDKVIENREHYVYVRARNRGDGLARDVKATVYWSEVSSLVTPNMWHEIGAGGAEFDDITNDDALVVSKELVWPADATLTKGHYCFVALIGAAGDPMPAPGAFTNFDQFREFIQGNNNAAWRNFNVVEPEVGTGDIPPMPFWTPGAFDEDREFDMQIWIDDPTRATVEVEMEPPTLERFGMTLDAVARVVDPGTGNARLDVNGVAAGHDGVRPFGRARFPKFDGPDPEAAGVDRMKLHVTFGALTTADPVEIDVVQLEAGIEVGRVSWLVYPRATVVDDDDSHDDMT